MATFNVQGLNYPDACKLIDHLKTSGIEANISPGCVTIYINTAAQTSLVQNIAKQFGTVLDIGYSSDVEHSAMQYDEGYESLVRNDTEARKLLGWEK